LGDIISVGDSLVITIFSMVVVFAVLAVIAFLIGTLKNIGGEKKVETVKEVVAQVEVKEPMLDTTINDEELVAVITAAIAASLGVSVPEINIKNIRRMPQTTPAWSVASRQEQIFSKL
jgi:sodium pump decarboxylase gamma subunit